jgi:hypothetical protein
MAGMWPDEALCESKLVPNGYGKPIILHDLTMLEGKELYDALYEQIAAYLGYSTAGVKLPPVEIVEDAASVEG